MILPGGHGRKVGACSPLGLGAIKALVLAHKEGHHFFEAAFEAVQPAVLGHAILTIAARLDRHAAALATVLCHRVISLAWVCFGGLVAFR